MCRERGVCKSGDKGEMRFQKYENIRKYLFRPNKQEERVNLNKIKGPKG